MELREALASHGLETKGVRTVLVNRLKDYLKETGASDKAPNAPSYDPTNPTEDTDPITQFGDKRFINVPAKVKYYLIFFICLTER